MKPSKDTQSVQNCEADRMQYDGCDQSEGSLPGQGWGQDGQFFATKTAPIAEEEERAGKIENDKQYRVESYGHCMRPMWRLFGVDEVAMLTKNGHFNALSFSYGYHDILTLINRLNHGDACLGVAKGLPEPLTGLFL